ncbi:patatin-like phospholipase family protein [Variovorax sp. OV329]|uniref:patatin-like phospholipase family protein n=1 Tax=Variovorax sp. OV329 TaxID=1882825 RepID=UPI0008EED4A8|nr:patatin-like phospholipase family protein [Variovorax sp. OV329]SFM03483.1 Patatin-like phospholipase [Variovorax sp. OV329]
MEKAIADMVGKRRTALFGKDDGRRAWGLALSGGGIRSATFCLGLMKALAQHRQLLRFDIVSTVSGGGYVGSTLGRLCSRARDADGIRAVEGAFAEVDKVRFGWWLRGNGRYLIPGGMRDMLFAVALFLRNLLGTHIELAIAATLVGLVLAAINLGAWEIMAGLIDLDNEQQVIAPIRWATQLPTLWLAALVPWLISIVLADGYWAVRDRSTTAGMLGQVALWAALGTGVWWVGPVLEERYGGPIWLAPAFIVFASCWVVALSWVLMRRLNGQTPGVLRNELTDGLATVLYVMIIIGLLGLLDRAAWWLAAHTRELRASYGGVLLIAAGAMRGLLPMLFAGKRETPGIAKSLMMALASVFGLVVAFCLAAWWIGVLYAAVLLPVFTPQGLDFSRGWIWWGTIGIVIGAYALFTGRNFGFLNASSLHMFYKARIVRGYLGAANRKRLGAEPTDALSGLAPPRVPVGQVEEDDDIPIAKYAPHEHGGPVHLVNVCINQTHDPKQQLFNRDRKSLPLTIGPTGWMQAAGAPWTLARPKGALTLGAWAAISGAAFAPGLGRLTKRGIAALSVFAGLRLGYWWDSKEAGLEQQGAARRVSNFLMKSRFILLECFAAFPGSGSPFWYLSDGGHFENTGAYALLREEAELIVIADCGADPDYRFHDLENLIRRARIDLNADIDFLKPNKNASWGKLGVFGSLNDLASSSSQACLALARVTYASGQRGHILLVKPNVSSDLAVDLVNFKAANPLFPQQPTTDQFFDEAQWECYFRLGAAIGERLDADMLERVAQGVPGLFSVDDGQAGPVGAAAENGNGTVSGAVASMGRLQARVLKAGAVTASLGIGTAATFGVALWQSIDTVRTEEENKQRAENAAFKDLTERWARLRAGGGGPSEATSLLAAELLRTGDLLCREGRENFMANFRLSVRIVDDAKAACANDPPQRRTPACARLLDRSNGIDCLQPVSAPPCKPRYWARDYTGRTPPQENCSGFSTASTSFVTALVARANVPFTIRFREVQQPPPLPMPVPPPVPAEVASGGDGAAPPEALPSPAGAAPPSDTASGGAAPETPSPSPSAAVPAEPAVVARASRPAGATASAPAAPAPPLAPPDPNVCAGALVYIQVYGSEAREQARSFRKPWRALGASVPPVEDVLESSRAAGRAPPAGHRRPTILYHDAAQLACAEAMSRTVLPPTVTRWTLQALPSPVSPTPGTIEVWLPRPVQSNAVALRQTAPATGSADGY